LALAVVAPLDLAGLSRRLGVYWNRSCTGRVWKRAFPSAGKREIRRFLRIFVDAFGFPHSRTLRFLPSDSPLAIYRTVYPDRSMPDGLELETFAGDLLHVYHLDLAALWREDLTLGEIFSATRPPGT
jgi:hypothetical protein